MMDRKAVKVLESYGWEQGKGLGRNESGVVDSIRVARKSNTKGLGQKGSHWGNDWWDRMYSSALDNVGGADNESKIKKAQKEKKEEKLVFGTFTKAKTLSTLDQESSGESDQESEEELEDPEEAKRKQKAMHHMDDNSVFEACNGLILRKFVPIGKLERIAEQDKKFMQAQKAKAQEKEKEIEERVQAKAQKKETEAQEQKKAKKRKRERKEEEKEEEDSSPPKKKQKKKEGKEETKEERKKRKRKEKKRKEKAKAANEDE